MNRKEDLIYYDFEGWPIFKKNLKELLLSLGGKQENGKIIFDENDPSMDVYPILLEDDGMAYGVNEQIITEASVFTDEDNNTHVTIFKENIPSEKMLKELFKRWEDDEEIVLSEIKKSK